MNSTEPESFEQFKNSFSYGSRSDLNFKFLKSLTPDEAADFFQSLLWKLGNAFDSGDYAPVREHVIEGQVRAYGPSSWTYEDRPLTKLARPLGEATVGLISSTGHFPEGEDPQPFGVENMSQTEAMNRINDFLKIPPTLTEIPIDLSAEKLRVRHGGYDIRGVEADHNVALPLDHFRRLNKEGVIGRFHEPAYSFVGACAQTPLLKEVGPRWVNQLQAEGIDALVMVPV